MAGPTITAQPQSRVVNYASSNSATITATSSGGSLTYQWYQQYNNGAYVAMTNINGWTGTTTATLSVAVTTQLNTGNFYCIVTDSNGSVQSNTIYLLGNVYFTDGNTAGDGNWQTVVNWYSTLYIAGTSSSVPIPGVVLGRLPNIYTDFVNVAGPMTTFVTGNVWNSYVCLVIGASLGGTLTLGNSTTFNCTLVGTSNVKNFVYSGTFIGTLYLGYLSNFAIRSAITLSGCVITGSIVMDNHPFNELDITSGTISPSSWTVPASSNVLKITGNPTFTVAIPTTLDNIYITGTSVTFPAGTLTLGNNASNGIHLYGTFNNPLQINVQNSGVLTFDSTFATTKLMTISANSTSNITINNGANYSPAVTVSVTPTTITNYPFDYGFSIKATFVPTITVSSSGFTPVVTRSRILTGM